MINYRKITPEVLEEFLIYHNVQNRKISVIDFIAGWNAAKKDDNQKSSWEILDQQYDTPN